MSFSVPHDAPTENAEPLQYYEWEADGAKDYATRAHEYARQLVESHQPQGIDDAIDSTLKELYGSALF